MTAVVSYREQAERTLRTALSEADSSVLEQPLKELQQLEVAAKDDINQIKLFTGGIPQQDVLRTSLDFWKSKMDHALSAYVNNPEVNNSTIY